MIKKINTFSRVGNSKEQYINSIAGTIVLVAVMRKRSKAFSTVNRKEKWETIPVYHFKKQEEVFLEQKQEGIY